MYTLRHGYDNRYTDLFCLDAIEKVQYKGVVKAVSVLKTLMLLNLYEKLNVVTSLNCNLVFGTNLKFLKTFPIL